MHNELHRVTKNLEKAQILRRECQRTIEDIDSQLAEKDFRIKGGRRLTTEEYHHWRRSALRRQNDWKRTRREAEDEIRFLRDKIEVLKEGVPSPRSTPDVMGAVFKLLEDVDHPSARTARRLLNTHFKYIDIEEAS